jgi:hypothetical protein
MRTALQHDSAADIVRHFTAAFQRLSVKGEWREGFRMYRSMYKRRVPLDNNGFSVCACACVCVRTCVRLRPADCVFVRASVPSFVHWFVRCSLIRALCIRCLRASTAPVRVC